MNDFDTLNPTADDLADVLDLDVAVAVEDDEDDDAWEDDYAPRDDRWEGSGVPSWSAWA